MKCAYTNKLPDKIDNMKLQGASTPKISIGSGNDTEYRASVPATVPKNAPKAVRSVSSNRQVFQDDSEKYREEIIRRYDAPFYSSWELGSTLSGNQSTSSSKLPESSMAA
jgi:hypothetical protein